MKKYYVEFEKVSDMALLGNTKRGEDGFGSTGGVGGITKVIKLDESDPENNDSQSENEMLILPAKKVITQTDWLEITAEKARIQTDDGKIIIDEKYEKKKMIFLDESKICSNNIINVFVRRYVYLYK